MRLVLVMGMLAAASAALGQEPNQPARSDRTNPAEQMRTLQQKAMRLIGAMQELGDWDEHYEYITDATERVFERNGWDSESDLAALEMAREVGKIPPWRSQERFDAALEMVGDRYLLDEGQLATLQTKALQMNIELFTKHSDRILEYALEAVETRAAGEPFTPEQVAHWTRLAEPVFVDARKSMNRAAKDFMEELDPEQRELLQLDLDAANKRMSGIEHMAENWKRGGWDPHDWGMEDDPIQNRGREQAATGAEGAANSNAARAAGQGGVRASETPEAPPREARPKPSKPKLEPTADDAWARYVKAFILKYALDNEQQQRAWIFYRHAKERDGIFAKRYDRNMKRLGGKTGTVDSESSRAALKKESERRVRESDRIFGQLKQRLERLPTRAQRKNTVPDQVETPAKSPAKPAAKKEP